MNHSCSPDELVFIVVLGFEVAGFAVGFNLTIGYEMLGIALRTSAVGQVTFVPVSIAILTFACLRVSARSIGRAFVFLPAALAFPF